MFGTRTSRTQVPYHVPQHPVPLTSCSAFTWQITSVDTQESTCCQFTSWVSRTCCKWDSSSSALKATNSWKIVMVFHFSSAILVEWNLLCILSQQDTPDFTQDAAAFCDFGTKLHLCIPQTSFPAQTAMLPVDSNGSKIKLFHKCSDPSALPTFYSLYMACYYYILDCSTLALYLSLPYSHFVVQTSSSGWAEFCGYMVFPPHHCLQLLEADSGCGTEIHRFPSQSNVCHWNCDKGKKRTAN